MALSPVTGGPRRAASPDYIIERIQRWVALYGEPPRAADWNPSSARWSNQEWRVERYRKGDPESGEPWPSLNVAKRPFGGSLNAAVKAAGFEPAKSGPKRRDAIDRETAVLGLPPESRVLLEDREARIRELEEKLVVRDRELTRARNARIVRTPPITLRPAAGPRVKEVKVRDEDLVAEAKELRRERAALRKERDAAVRKAREAADQAKEGRERLMAASAEDRKEAVRLRRLVSQRDAALALARERTEEAKGDLKRLEKLRAPVEVKEVERVRKEVVYRDAPEIAVLEASEHRAVAALRKAEAAEAQAARSDAEYMALASAVSGEPRRLTAAEIRALRQKGPAGPAVLAAALKEVAGARAGRGDLRAALLKLATAAVSWSERT